MLVYFFRAVLLSAFFLLSIGCSRITTSQINSYYTIAIDSDPDVQVKGPSVPTMKIDLLDDEDIDVSNTSPKHKKRLYSKIKQRLESIYSARAKSEEIQIEKESVINIGISFKSLIMYDTKISLSNIFHKNGRVGFLTSFESQPDVGICSSFTSIQGIFGLYESASGLSVKASDFGFNNEFLTFCEKDYEVSEKRHNAIIKHMANGAGSIISFNIGKYVPVIASILERKDSYIYKLTTKPTLLRINAGLVHGIKLDNYVYLPRMNVMMQNGKLVNIVEMVRIGTIQRADKDHSWVRVSRSRKSKLSNIEEGTRVWVFSSKVKGFESDKRSETALEANITGEDKGL